MIEQSTRVGGLYGLANASALADVPKNVTSASVLGVLDNSNSLLVEAENVLCAIFTSLQGPVPTTNEAKPDQPQGINAMLLDVQSRAMRLRDGLVALREALG